MHFPMLNAILPRNVKIGGRLLLYPIILFSFFAVGLGGCSDGGQNLFETAQFEEQQNNPAHARKLYQQIINDYPDGEYAKKAKDRLTQLNTRP